VFVGAAARRRPGGPTKFHVIFATGWDHQADEPLGGRCLDTCDTLEEAVEESRLLVTPVGAGPGLAERSYGPGQVVVTDAEHHSVAVNGELLAPPEPAPPYLLAHLVAHLQVYSQDSYVEFSCLDPRD
jgi:hypothetical protein